jgi:uncharacterized protein YjiS (DUF1127 family)
MSTISSAPTAVRGRGHFWALGLTTTLKSWWVACMSWRTEQAAIAQLSALSDRALKDIGLARSEITGAVRIQVKRKHGFHRSR